MPGRMFIVSIDITSATSNKDLIEIIAGAGVPLVVHEIYVSTDIEQNANEAQIPLQLARRVGAYTTGSGGSVASGYALGKTGATEDSATIRTGSTTKATGGTAEIFSDPFVNNRIGWHYLPTPEARPTIDATDALILSMGAAAPAATAWGGHAIYEEAVG